MVEVNLVDADQDPLQTTGGNTGFSLKGDGLIEEEQQQLGQLLHKWEHIFSTHDEDNGCTDVKHRIPTGRAYSGKI